MASRFESGLIGAAIAAYAFLDDLVLGPLLVGLSAWLPWWVMLPAAWAAFTLLNLACCEWLQRRWSEWSQGYGRRIEAMIEKRRRSRLLRRPLSWVTRDSDVWFTVAAGLIGTIIVFALVRLAGAPPLGRRRILYGSAAYSFGFAATYAGIGIGIGELVRHV